jgi:hypothetical protein
MPESLTTEILESFPFVLSAGVEWRVRLGLLPLRAIAALTIRCTKRREPLLRLDQLKTEAFSRGVDACNFGNSDVKPIHHAIGAVGSGAANGVHITSEEGNAADTDLKNLLDLNLGTPGEPGEPISWNDRRLGPLWPKGMPECFVKAVQEGRELEKKLRSLPDSNAPPDDPLLIAQLEDWTWLNQLRDEGKLNEYRGEYVFAAEKQIFGHGRNLVELRPSVEEAASAKGIPPQRVIDYFIPGE